MTQKLKHIYILLLIILGLLTVAIWSRSSSFQGVDYSSLGYSSFEGFESGSGGTGGELKSGMELANDQGGKIIVKQNSDGSLMLETTINDKSPSVTLTQEQPKENKEGMNVMYAAKVTNYYGPQGSGISAVVFRDTHGRQAIKVVTLQGTYLYYQWVPPALKENVSNIEYGHVQGPYHSANYLQGPAGNTAVNVDALTLPTASDINAYSSSLPPGIPGSQIPPGDEDLYILKSQVVPPVCPKCPSCSKVVKKEVCPPCPACARCPENDFECKKVPNYSAFAENNFGRLPMPYM